MRLHDLVIEGQLLRPECRWFDGPDILRSGTEFALPT